MRGFVYEAAGSVDPGLLEVGSAIVLRAREAYRMRVEVMDRDPAETAGWLEAMRASLGRVLGEARAA